MTYSLRIDPGGIRPLEHSSNSGDDDDEQAPSKAELVNFRLLGGRGDELAMARRFSVS